MPEIQRNVNSHAYVGGYDAHTPSVESFHYYGRSMSIQPMRPVGVNGSVRRMLPVRHFTSTSVERSARTPNDYVARPHTLLGTQRPASYEGPCFGSSPAAVLVDAKMSQDVF